MSFQKYKYDLYLCKTLAGPDQTWPSLNITVWKVKFSDLSLHWDHSIIKLFSTFTLNIWLKQVQIPSLLKMLCSLTWFWDLPSPTSISILITLFSVRGFHFTWKMFLAQPCWPLLHSVPWPGHPGLFQNLTAPRFSFPALIAMGIN